MSTINEQLIHVARCLAEAEKRLRALEGKSAPTHYDLNRVDGELRALHRELAEAQGRVELSAKREFDAKDAALGERLETGLAQIRTDLQVNIRGLNPRGNWESGMVLNRNDVVSVNGSSYLVLRDGVTAKPSARDTENFQLLARRGGVGGFAGGTAGFVSPPSGANSAGNPGEFSYDADYYYVCVAANTWLRTSIATW